MSENTKIKAITVKAACELLGCSRMTFYTKHKSRLTQLPSVGNKSLFVYDQVVAMKSIKDVGESDKYEIVG